MAIKNKQDHARFLQIVRGRIKQNLQKYMARGELIGKRGKDKISIPVPQIDLPRFKFDHRDTGGVGQGEGDVGQSLQPGNVEPGQGGQAGQSPGDHALEIEVSLDDLAHMMGEALELPNIKPRGQAEIAEQRSRYTGIQATGPQSLRHVKRTYKQALRRTLLTGDYDPKNPRLVPMREDFRYRSTKPKTEPQTQAVVIYMMDVSGSMGDEQKELVRMASFWLDTWLSSQYKGIQTRYIIHDAMAKEVDQETFFHTRESGGTMISSAYKLCANMIDTDYASQEFNIYPFHFSDGDNWSSDDTRVCMDLVRQRLLPVVNAFCYGQVESPYGSGQFVKDLREAFANEKYVLTSEIPNKEAIATAMKDFLGKGH